MKVFTKGLILLGIFMFAYIFVVSGAGTILKGDTLTYQGVGTLEGIRNIEMVNTSLIFGDNTDQTISAIFNAKLGDLPIQAQSMAVGNGSFFFPNTTTGFLGDVDNFDNVDALSRFRETNLNNGSSAVAGFTVQNDIGVTANFGIGSSNFMVGAANRSNQPAIVSFSGEGFNFVNFVGGDWEWVNNPSGDPTNTTRDIVMNLSSEGNLDIGGNFTGNQFYGEMFVEGNIVPTPISSANNFTVIEVLLEGSLNGFDVIDSTLIVLINGTYQINYGMTFSDANNKDYRSSVGVNDVAQDKCVSGRRIANVDFGNMGSTCLLSLVEGDNVTLVINNLDGAQDPTVEDANINLVRIGS